MDYTKTPNPKPTETSGMKWTDYFWSEGGWIGWIIAYWWLFGEFFDIKIPFITERIAPVDMKYLFGFFLIIGLVLTKSAFHYRKKWNNKFKKLKDFYLTNYENKENEANNIFNKMKFLLENYTKNQSFDQEEWNKLLEKFDKYRCTFSNKIEIKQLKGDTDYYDET